MGTFRGDPSSNVSDRVALSPSAMVSRSSDAMNVTAGNGAVPRHSTARIKITPGKKLFFNRRSIFSKPLKKFRK